MNVTTQWGVQSRVSEQEEINGFVFFFFFFFLLFESVFMKWINFLNLIESICGAAQIKILLI